MARKKEIPITQRSREELLEWLRGGKEGVQRWNDANIRPFSKPPVILRNIIDLHDADLSGADLKRINFEGVDLHGANFTDANLHMAVLDWANLSHACLLRANLRTASFELTDLSHANVAQADLVRTSIFAANCQQTNFERSSLLRSLIGHTDLTGARLTGTIVGGTAFQSVNLSQVIGLEAAHFTGPCTIGIDTLYKSRGKIPEAFLRGCGVPEEMIRYIPSIIGSQAAIDFYSCFISYSTNDEEFVRRLNARLRQENLRVWCADEDMKAGRKVHEQIEEAIRVHDKLLLVLSEYSMNSEWVKHEILTARKREKREGRTVLFPIMLCPFDLLKDWTCFDSDTGKDVAAEVRAYYVPGFSEWKAHDKFEKAFDRLLRDLRKDE